MRESKYILDENRQPVPCPGVLEWGKWFEAAFRNKTRQVARTMVGDVRISTVFLGLDHSFSETGPLILYETMVFGGAMDEYQDRYSTWKEAEAGHRSTVEQVKRVRWWQDLWWYVRTLWSELRRAIWYEMRKRKKGGKR